MNKAPEHRELIGQLGSEIPDEPEHVASAVKWMRDQAACDRRADWVKLIFEGSRHAKISTAASNCPEQIGIFIVVELGRRRGYDLGHLR